MDTLDQTLMAYVDGELDPMQVHTVEQLIARDPALQARVQEYRDSVALLRAACAETFYADGSDTAWTPLAPPASFMPARRLAPARQVIWAAAACLIAAILGFGGGSYWSGRHQASAHDRLIDEIAEYHVFYARETTHLVEIGADRSDTLFAWLSERLNRPVKAPDLSQLGLNFAGGRLFVVDNKPVAALFYTRAHGSPIALCLTTNDAANSAQPGAIRFDEQQNTRLASWDDGKSTYVVVGDVPRQKLQRIASLVVAQNEN